MCPASRSASRASSIRRHGSRDRREERAAAELRDPQLDIVGSSRGQPRPGAAAVGRAVVGAWVALGAGELDASASMEFLQHEPDGIADQLHAVTGAEGVQDFDGPVPVRRVRSVPGRTLRDSRRRTSPRGGPSGDLEPPRPGTPTRRSPFHAGVRIRPGRSGRRRGVAAVDQRDARVHRPSPRSGSAELGIEHMCGASQDPAGGGCARRWVLRWSSPAQRRSERRRGVGWHAPFAGLSSKVHLGDGRSADLGAVTPSPLSLSLSLSTVTLDPVSLVTRMWPALVPSTCIVRELDNDRGPRWERRPWKYPDGSDALVLRGSSSRSSTPGVAGASWFDRGAGRI